MVFLKPHLKKMFPNDYSRKKQLFSKQLSL
jgi:hypothetical protein